MTERFRCAGRRRGDRFHFVNARYVCFQSLIGIADRNRSSRLSSPNPAGAIPLGQDNFITLFDNVSPSLQDLQDSVDIESVEIEDEDQFTYRDGRSGN